MYHDQAEIDRSDAYGSVDLRRSGHMCDTGAHDTAAGPEAAEDSDDDGALERRSKRRTDRNA